MKSFLACSLALLPLAAGAEDSASAKPAQATDAFAITVENPNTQPDCVKTTWFHKGADGKWAEQSLAVPVFTAAGQVFVLEKDVQTFTPSPKEGEQRHPGIEYAHYTLKNLVSGAKLWESKAPNAHCEDPQDCDPGEDWTNAAVVAAVVGPYINIERRSEWTSPLGRSESETSAFLFDLEKSAVVDRAALGFDAEATKDKLLALKWEPEFIKEVEDPQPTIVSLRSALSSKGLSVSVLANIATSYALKDQVWDSASLSAPYTLTRLPDAIAAKVALPSELGSSAAVTSGKSTGMTASALDEKTLAALKTYLDKAPKACK